MFSHFLVFIVFNDLHSVLVFIALLFVFIVCPRPRRPRPSPSPSASAFASSAPPPSSSSSAACRGWCCCRVWQVRGCPILESGEVRGPSPLQGLVLGQVICTLQAPHEDHFRASIWSELEGHGRLRVHIVRECVDMRFKSFCVAGAGKSHDREVLVMRFHQELGRCGGSLRVRSDIAERAGLV